MPSHKVTVRTKPMTDNKRSQFLDIYPPIPNAKNGKPTRRKFLRGHFIYTPIEVKDSKRTGKSKEIFHTDPNENARRQKHNAEQINFAAAAAFELQNKLDKPELYSEQEKLLLDRYQKGQQCFVQYFKNLAETRNTSNAANWKSALKFLVNFTGGTYQFKDVTLTLCEQFKKYLLTTKSNKSAKAKLSQNSSLSYFNKFKAALREAYADGYLATDINAKLKPIKEASTQRNFLTIEEVKALAKTECYIPVLKQAALFSALTGLRHSDILKLVWREVEYSESQGYFIRFQQKKTADYETLPITKDAYSLLPQRGNLDDVVFQGLKYNTTVNDHLRQWVKDAGINKYITFHCMRHTAATLLLFYGKDFFATGKILGNKSIKTTQIYTKITDKAKRDAVESIPSIF